MAFKLRAANGTNKQYLYPTTDAAARGSRHWEYVSADAFTTVDGSGYIDGATNGGDHQIAYDMLSVGDLIWAFQVGAIDDDRSVEDDKAAGISDVSLHIVLDKTSGVVDLSDDLFGGAGTFAGIITYGD